MTTRKKKVEEPKIEGLKITIPHNQQNITSERVDLESTDFILIMPKTNVMTFKKKLYWFANILYRYWK